MKALHPCMKRALAESAKRLASIDEEAVRIRREAIDLQQKHQVRNKIQEQVEAFGSRITVLEEKKMKAVKRMRCLQGEEARLFQHMNGAVRKVCAQQRENTVKLDGEYQIIWSNVELLLGYCDKLLQMTRPEIEALKLDADKNVESNGMQPLVSISQCEIIENHSTVTSADTQSDAFVTQAQSPGQDITQHEDFPQTVESNTVSVVEKVHEESHIASMGNGSQFDVKNAGMHYEYISNEDHHGDIVVDNQELESAKVMSVASLPVQCKQPLPDEAELDLNTHSTQELHIERPSVMMTRDKKNNTIAESSSSPIYQDDAIATSLETSSENEVLLTDTSVKFVEAQHVSKLNDAEYFSSSQCKPSDLHASVVAPIVSDGVVEANIYVPVPHHNEMSMSDEGTILHISYTGSTAPSFSSMYQLCGSHNSTSSPFHTVSALAHVKGKAKKDKEDPIHRENEEEDNPVLAPEVIHEKEIDASGNQVGTSSSLTEQNEIVNIASACHVPGNLNVMLTEEQSPQSNALHPDNLNMTRPTTVDEELSADCISSNGKLNTTSII
ncbi:hypothetical protein GWK47_044617 [Chionoecetes opilio]|uniref:Uncharacterized protein n=1 Tax=Chionoecetes opilio TaxID=41210 RepID=A0A8J4Y903_CHIOP|nr:hypothetical protein GWK47_044617 [Chionoecetes opilio]